MRLTALALGLITLSCTARLARAAPPEASDADKTTTMDVPPMAKGNGLPSASMLEIHFSGFAGFGDLEVTRGGLTLVRGGYDEGLDAVLRASPAALALAKPIHHDLVLADVFSYLGVGLGIASTAMPIVAFVAQPNQSHTESAVIIFSSLAGGLLGTASTIFGSHFRILGFKGATDAINVYNNERIDPPAEAQARPQ